MKAVKCNVLIYFDNHICQKITTNVNSSYVGTLQELLQKLSLSSYDAVIIGTTKDVSKIILIIRKMTLAPIIILNNKTIEKERELIYAGADCVMDINSSAEEINLHLFSLLRRTKEWKDYPVGDIKNIIWCLVKRLRKKLNVVEDGAGNCIVSVRDIGYKFELNNENEKK